MVERPDGDPPREPGHVTGHDSGLVAGGDVTVSGRLAAGRDIRVENLHLTKRDIAPFNAPPDVTDFVDRGTELEQLATQLTGAAAGTVVVCLYGQGGVGKTALATRVLHHLRDAFPGGVLFAQLASEGGTTPDTRAVLSDFLYLLGVPTDSTSELRLVSAYRSAVSDRRVLVMLDNAQDARQAWQLLPVSPGSAAIVTSRAPLVDLDGVRTHRLDVLPAADSAELLVRLARLPAGSGTDPAARRVAELCGGLPLAVRVAGAKLGLRSDWTLASLAERMADQRRRLDVLRVGNLEVRTSLQLSYEGLPALEQRAFRRLATGDSEELPAWVLAPLLEVWHGESEELLDRLFHAQLVQVSREDGTGTTLYRLHDLVRLLARELLESVEPPQERAAAATRLHEAYLGLVGVAGDALRARGSGGGPAAADGGTRPGPTDPAHDRLVAGIRRDPAAWFIANRHGVLDAVGAAVELGEYEKVWRFEQSLLALLILSPHLDDRLLVHRLAVTAGKLSGDRVRHGQALVDLGRAERDFGSWEPADEHLASGVAILRDADEPARLAQALVVRAVLLAYVGRTAEAESVARECLRLFEAAGDVPAQAYALRTLGVVYRGQSRWPEAADVLRRSGDLFAAAGDRHRHAIVLVRRAGVSRALRTPAAALPLLDEAAASFAHLNFPLWLNITRVYRAAALADLGAVSEALAVLDDCRRELAQIGEQRWVDIARYHRARILAETADRPGDDARAELRDLVAGFGALGDTWSEATARLTLGRALVRAGQESRARRVLEGAAAAFDDLGNEPLRAEAEALLYGGAAVTEDPP